jgi:hypothetical protein
MASIKQTGQRLAVIAADQFGWLLDVDPRWVDAYFEESPSRALEWLTRRRKKSALRTAGSENPDRAGPWTVTVDPQFSRILADLRLAHDQARAVSELLDRIASNPWSVTPNSVGVRSINLGDLNAKSGVLPLRVSYILMGREIVVLGASALAA